MNTPKFIMGYRVTGKLPNGKRVNVRFGWGNGVTMAAALDAAVDALDLLETGTLWAHGVDDPNRPKFRDGVLRRKYLTLPIVNPIPPAKTGGAK